MKSAIYDGRISIPEHVKLREELISLEVDNKAVKIDHPIGGTKDLTDALAGVVYGLTMRREVWSQHRVIPGKAAPRLVYEARRLAHASVAGY